MTVADSAYARAGVDPELADTATAGLVAILSASSGSVQRRSVIGSRHYASVLRLTETLGLALSTDGVGSKAIVAEQLGRFETIGQDCVAMNTNDVICVAAKPIAMLDYISIEWAEPDVLRAIAVGLRAGAEQAGIEIPGGEVAQLPEMLTRHGAGPGFDLVGMCAGLVDLDSIITGSRIEVGDAIIGLPSNGIHANGLSLARAALPDLKETPAELAGETVGEVLLQPTHIYVEAVQALLGSGADVRGLAHITSESFRNLLRLDTGVGFRIDRPLPVPPLFELIAERYPRQTGHCLTRGEMWDVFNMGCGFCCVVGAADVDRAVDVLARYFPRTSVIGETDDRFGEVNLVDERLVGTSDRSFSAVSVT
jgi:phosphoribosylformylglycinamidine cyclo-ligase